MLERDNYRCMAPQLDGNAGWCKDAWGHIITRWPRYDRGPQYLQMSHVKDEDAPMMGKKATSDRYHLITLCPWHHEGTEAGSNWEARNRNRIRRHLERIYGLVRKDPS